MASKYVELSGKAYWAQLKQPDMKYGPKWRLTLYLDEPSLKVFEDSGLQLKVKEDELGKSVTLRRDVEKLINGKIVSFEPPTVTMNGKMIDDLVGNGSTVTCYVCVYDTVKGKGHRLVNVKVLDLVPYERGSDEPDVDLS